MKIDALSQTISLTILIVGADQVGKHTFLSALSTLSHPLLSRTPTSLTLSLRDILNLYTYNLTFTLEQPAS